MNIRSCKFDFKTPNDNCKMKLSVRLRKFIKNVETYTINKLLLSRRYIRAF